VQALKSWLCSSGDRNFKRYFAKAALYPLAHRAVNCVKITPRISAIALFLLVTHAQDKRRQ
jgi:hypothetical protein